MPWPAVPPVKPGKRALGMAPMAMRDVASCRSRRGVSAGVFIAALMTVVLLPSAAAHAQPAPQAQADLGSSFWAFHLEDYFGQTKPINLYMFRRGGKSPDLEAGNMHRLRSSRSDSIP